jgi:ATP/maltotriose-dependent transcriptional regulator MalT
MAVAITKMSQTAALLEELHRRHLFVNRRHAQESVYQFHALFRAFLQHRAQSLMSGDERKIVALHAARLLEEQGYGVVVAPVLEE